MVSHWVVVAPNGAIILVAKGSIPFRGLNFVTKRGNYMDDLINKIRKSVPTAIAEELCSVQPMDSNLFKDALDASKSEEWLRENGYEPVSSHKILWIKKD